jgi:plasmid stability protein
MLKNAGRPAPNLDRGSIPEPEWIHPLAAMPSLSIKDVPEHIAEALRRRAALNHRSLQGELMAILQQAVQAGSAPVPAADPGSPEGRPGERTIEEIAAQRRSRYPEPVRGGPLAVDLIRAERDSR